MRTSLILPLLWGALSLPASVHAQNLIAPSPVSSASSASSALNTYRFDIPKGPLDEAVARFEALTGLKVVMPSGISLHIFTSPGVSGVHTAEQALERLLAATSLQFRAAAGGATRSMSRSRPNASTSPHD